MNNAITKDEHNKNILKNKMQLIIVEICLRGQVSCSDHRTAMSIQKDEYNGIILIIFDTYVNTHSYLFLISVEPPLLIFKV